jgi:hypothetical protein
VAAPQRRTACDRCPHQRGRGSLRAERSQARVSTGALLNAGVPSGQPTQQKRKSATGGETPGGTGGSSPRGSPTPTASERRKQSRNGESCDQTQRRDSAETSPGRSCRSRGLSTGQPINCQLRKSAHVAVRIVSSEMRKHAALLECLRSGNNGPSHDVFRIVGAV